MYDVHTHFIPMDVINWLKDNQKVVKAEWIKKDPQKEEFLSINDKWPFELKKSLVDLPMFLEKRHSSGVAHSLVSPIPQVYLYDFPYEVTAEIVGVFNRALSGLVRQYPEELSAIGTVSLNNPQQAANELRESMNAGLKGAMIGPGTSGYMLSDDFFKPFWEEADKQRAIIFIHPLLNEDVRLKRRMMPNLIGVPWETTLCATDILLSGMLDIYPNVKILLSHGGGFLPYQIGRLKRGYEQWKVVSSSLHAPPEEYLKRFWYDTILWDPTALQYLIDTVGEDRVVPGSDYPFDLSNWPPVAPNEKGIQTLLYE